MISRYNELDSLRGIAALMVLLGHFLTVIPDYGKEIMYSSYGTFINILWNGHSAVIMFFLLSGFVLSLPFYRNSEFIYSKYLIKRICRIYIPYIVVLAVALLLNIGINSKIGTETGIVFWGKWDIDITLKNILEHVFFLGEYNSDAFLMVIWSLVHELRISVVFPFVVLLLLRMNWKTGFLFSLGLSTIGYLLMNIAPTQFDKLVSTSYFATFHYMGMFIIGALIAKHREYLINKRFSFKMSIAFIPFAVLFLNYPEIPLMLPYKLFGEIDFLLYKIMIDYVITIGASLIIITALKSIIFSKILLWKPIHFLGNISYSLYLVHPVVLISLIHVLGGTLSVPLILLLSLILTLVFSWLSYKFIEQPSIKLGRILSKSKVKNTPSRKKSA